MRKSDLKSKGKREWTTINFPSCQPCWQFIWENVIGWDLTVIVSVCHNCVKVLSQNQKDKNLIQHTLTTNDEHQVHWLYEKVKSGFLLQEIIKHKPKRPAYTHTCVSLCVFLYLLHTDYQNTHSTCKMRTFLGNEYPSQGITLRLRLKLF